LYWSQCVWRQVDVAGVLLLGGKRSRASPIVRALVGDCDVRIDW
jgi:hypothetical protein